MADPYARISVIIPTLNADDRLPALLESLRGQRTPPDEIIIVDSSSQDSTVELARAAGCRVEVIPQASFQHGGARNLGAQLAEGTILVYLTQDALPADADFLDQLIQPLVSGQAAAAAARQLAAPGASPLERYARQQNYPADSFIRNQADVEQLGVMAYFFSNAASSVDRRIFEKLGGFPQSVIVNEDMLFCARLLQAGYQVAYQAGAVAYHSHDFGLVEQFQRYFDIGVFFAQAEDALGRAAPGGRGLAFAVGQLAHLLRTGSWMWMPRSAAESLLKAVGYALGKHWRRLPHQFCQAFSRQKSFWDALPPA